MAEAKSTVSEGNLKDANSDTDLFKSLSDISITQPISGPSSKDYKPSLLAKSTVRVISSTIIAPLDIDDDDQSNANGGFEGDQTNARRGRSRNRLKTHWDDSPNPHPDNEFPLTSTQNDGCVTVRESRSTNRVAGKRSIEKQQGAKTKQNRKRKNANQFQPTNSEVIVNDSIDNMEGLTEDTEMGNAEMIKTIKQLFSTTLDSVNDKVDSVNDNLNTDITKRIADLEMSEYKHHVENATAQKSTEERITHRLEALEKINKKRSGELEKKIEQTNRKLSVQIQKILRSKIIISAT